MEDAGDAPPGTVGHMEDAGDAPPGTVGRMKDAGDAPPGAMGRTKGAGNAPPDTVGPTKDAGDALPGTVGRTKDAGDAARKPGNLKLRTLISQVRVDGREYRLIRSEQTARRLVLLDQECWLQAFADQAAIKQLATAWALAAVSPRSIVHVPMRQNESPHEGRRLDLVLSHHSLQLRPSRWRALRARFGRGTPHTVRIPDPGTPTLDYSRFWHREYRDLLRFDNAADTLFVAGAHESFFRAAVDLRKLLTETTDPDPPAHACAELDSGRWASDNDPRHGTPRQLHIQYEPADW